MDFCLRFRFNSLITFRIAFKMSYTTKEAILKLGDIDPEFEAVSSCKPSSLPAPSSSHCRSLRSSICRQWTTWISLFSRKWLRNARRQTLRRSVLLHQTSSRQTTKSPYMTAQQFVLGSTSQCRLQLEEAHSLLCKRPVLLYRASQFPTGKTGFRKLTAVTQQVSRRWLCRWYTRGRRADLSQLRPSVRSRMH